MSEPSVPSPSPLAAGPLLSEAVMDQLAQLMDNRLARQEADLHRQLDELRAEHARPPPVTPGDTFPHATAGTMEIREEKKAQDIEKQRRLVHSSRQSVSNLVSSAVYATFHNHGYADRSSPFRASPTAQTRESFERRLSQGVADIEEVSPTADQAAAASGPLELALPRPTPVRVTTAAVRPNNMTTEQFRNFATASKQIQSTITKFHGLRSKDGNRTVQEFVQLVNAEMDSWLGEQQQIGRLNLVIGLTDGAAQMWLVKKRVEMLALRNSGQVVEPLLMEWCELQADFITDMSRGITSIVYEQQLRALRLRDKDGKIDIVGFIQHFDEAAARRYPATQGPYPMTAAVC